MKSSKNRRWTPDEDMMLKTLAGTKSVDDLVVILGRSELSIRGRLARIGISINMAKGKAKPAAVNRLRAEMIKILLNAGYESSEISNAMAGGVNICTARDIETGRTWRTL